MIKKTDFSILSACLLILPGVLQAATCTTAGGIWTIGTEYFATRDYGDGHFDYDIGMLKCSADQGEVVRWNGTDLGYASPNDVLQPSTIYRTTRVFRNKCGSLGLLVHDSFRGTINDGSVTVNLSPAATPLNNTYIGRFKHGITPGKGEPIPCRCNSDETVAQDGECVPVSETKPGMCPSAGNPVNIATGRKYAQEVVYADPAGKLSFIIHYNSRTATDLFKVQHGLGAYWVSHGHAQIKAGDAKPVPDYVSVLRPTGQLFRFNRQSGSETAYIPDADINERLTRTTAAGNNSTSGWKLFTASGVLETYDAAGRLLSVADQGHMQTLSYDAQSRLATMTDTFGRRLDFAYDAQGRVTQLTPPDGQAILFSYDDANNLASITWPDGGSKRYHYEDSRFPNNLTGITDENGQRYATWTYDSQGRAISSEHAGGADKVTLTYGGDGNTTVTDARGTSRTQRFSTILGDIRSTGESQPGGSGCGPSASSLTYDANGNIATRTDFNGIQTTYTYDSGRNLETQRVEAKGKPEQRTFNTQWHTYWRFPARQAEPNKLTTWVYNGDGGVYCAPQSATLPSISGGTQPIGVLCRKTEQATTDANGSQGFSATVTGPARTWAYTYDALGHLLTADGPRTDINDLATYTYYDANDPDPGKRGQLASITNALGHLTRITTYDLNGNPLSLTDPNGVQTLLTYDARQRLTSRQVGDERTTYQYDAAGQLLRVTLPDNSGLDYTYDAAHRLTSIRDTLGNQILYTLDAMGNRIKEEIHDPQGALTRTKTRAYDALNRLQTLTGVGE